MMSKDDSTENDRYCLIHLFPIYEDEVDLWRWVRKGVPRPPDIRMMDITWYYSREEAIANRPEDFWS